MNLSRDELTIIDDYFNSIHPFIFQWGLDEAHVGVKNLPDQLLAYGQYWWVTENDEVEINICVDGVHVYYTGPGTPSSYNKIELEFSDPEFGSKLLKIINLEPQPQPRLCSCHGH